MPKLKNENVSCITVEGLLIGTQWGGSSPRKEYFHQQFTNDGRSGTMVWEGLPMALSEIISKPNLDGVAKELTVGVSWKKGGLLRILFYEITPCIALNDMYCPDEVFSEVKLSEERRNA